MALASDLYLFWQTVPPGVGVSLLEMMVQLGVTDDQQLRIALSKLRKGAVPDPAARGQRFPELPVRYNPPDRRYYHLGRLSADAVAAQVPGNVMAAAFSQLLTRVMTIGSALGPAGIVQSATLLGDAETRALIGQFPVGIVHRVEDQVREIGRARTILALTEARTGGQLPGIEAGDRAADGGVEEADDARQ